MADLSLGAVMELLTTENRRKPRGLPKVEFADLDADYWSWLNGKPLPKSGRFIPDIGYRAVVVPTGDNILNRLQKRPVETALAAGIHHSDTPGYFHVWRWKTDDKKVVNGQGLIDGTRRPMPPCFLARLIYPDFGVTNPDDLRVSQREESEPWPHNRMLFDEEIPALG